MAMRSAGKAILLLSSNLDEILALSDRIAVMYKGEVVGIFDNECLDRESLGDYMLGLKRQTAEERMRNAAGGGHAGVGSRVIRRTARPSSSASWDPSSLHLSSP